MNKALCMSVVAGLAVLVAGSAAGHQGPGGFSFYASESSAAQFFDRTTLRPYGAYDGLFIHLSRTVCHGYPRQVRPETSSPTLHTNTSTLFKHHLCAGDDARGRVWSFVAHALKYKYAFSYLQCHDEYAAQPCPKR